MEVPAVERDCAAVGEHGLLDTAQMLGTLTARGGDFEQGARYFRGSSTTTGIVRSVAFW